MTQLAVPINGRYLANYGTAGIADINPRVCACPQPKIFLQSTPAADFRACFGLLSGTSGI
jgi:hypothetical protein